MFSACSKCMFHCRLCRYLLGLLCTCNVSKAGELTSIPAYPFDTCTWKLLSWLFGCLVVWLFDGLVVWWFGCLVVCLVGCLFVWLAGWLPKVQWQLMLKRCCSSCGIRASNPRKGMRQLLVEPESKLYLISGKWL